MKMNKNIISPYNKTLSILAICFCLILAFVLLCPTMQVFADYNELSENTIVNFNQQFNNTLSARANYNTITFSKSNNYTYNVSGTFTSYSLYLSFTTSGELYVNLINGHKYYIDPKLNVISGNNPNLILGNEETHYIQNITNNIYTSSVNATAYFGYWHKPSGTYNFSVSPMIIDLTMMFGENNDNLTLTQCQDLFSAQYYSYTTGTNMPLSKSYLQGYQEGAQSVYESMTITYNSYTIGANSQTYSNNTIERGMLEFDQQYSAYAFSGVIAINLLGEVQRGTNISIDFELTIPDLQGESSSYAETFTLYFAYVDNNNNLVDITGIQAHYLGGWDNQYRGDFVLPITTTTLYCYLDYNTIGDNFGPTQAIAFKSDITFVGLDVAQLVNNAYNKGASDTTAKYSYGGVLYQSIYDLGKAEGIAESNSYATGLDVIATTFTQVFSIFNIEILPGIPLTIFILLPLLFGLIMFIVKLTKGD